MSAYCKLVNDGELQRCEVCGATFAATGRVRAVCGIVRVKPKPAFAGGPGTELKRLLASIGINASSNCACNGKAKTMDVRGVEWCTVNVGTIVGWLREEASRRGLPFVDVVGRMLVRRAIHNARKEAQRAEATT